MEQKRAARRAHQDTLDQYGQERTKLRRWRKEREEEKRISEGEQRKSKLAGNDENAMVLNAKVQHSHPGTRINITMRLNEIHDANSSLPGMNLFPVYL